MLAGTSEAEDQADATCFVNAPDQGPGERGCSKAALAPMYDVIN